MTSIQQDVKIGLSGNNMVTPRNVRERRQHNTTSRKHLLSFFTSLFSMCCVLPWIPSYSIIFLLKSQIASAVIILPSNEVIQSRTANFGTFIDQNTFYSAHLQKLKDDEYLCGGKHNIKPNDIDNGFGLEYENDDGIYDSFTSDNEFDSLFIQTTKVNDTIIQPSDGIPVALLAKRGVCDFETKAKTAMKIGHVVQFVIVADFPGTFQGNLIQMNAQNLDKIDVGMLFVSHDSGMELAGAIDTTASNRITGGPIVEINGAMPTGYGYDNPQKLMLASLAGFFLFLSFFGCVMMCCQSAYIERDGNVIMIGFRNQPTENGETPPTNRLLTREQVLTLPEIEYKSVDNTTPADQQQPLQPSAEPASLASKPPASSDKEAQNSLSALSAHEETHEGLSSNTTCSICLEDYVEGEKLRVLPCNHVFHTECIVPWLTDRNSNCPLCKSEVTVIERDTSNGSSNNNTTTRSGRLAARISALVPRFVINRIPQQEATNNQNTVNDVTEGTDTMQSPLLQNARSPQAPPPPPPAVNPV